VFIAGANDRLWKRLAVALGLADMADDPRFATNVERVKHRTELERRVGDAIAGHDREALLKLLEKADVPATPVNTVDQVLGDAQTATRPTIRRVAHPKLGDIPVVGMPLTFGGMNPGVRRHAPMRGEHTDEVLAEYGYSAPAIADLRTRKVVA
jgi:formyl-CoA transferase/CoA:oxalate CoA-transferase